MADIAIPSPAITKPCIGQTDKVTPLRAKPILVAAVGLVLINRLLMRLKILRPVDGWRRATTFALADEPARFVLSAFNLDALSDSPRDPAADLQSRITHRLTQFLQSETEFHLCTRKARHRDEIIPTPGPAFTLRFDPWLEGPARFIRPDEWAGKSAIQLTDDASPIFEFVFRVAPDNRTDLWVRINHAAVDGAAVQEMLTRLEQSWGTRGPLVFPCAESFHPFTVMRRSPGRPGIAEVQTFLDFTPILAWRKRVNEKLREPITLGAAIAWWIGKHPHFTFIHLGNTVEIPRIGSLNRGVSIIVFRPSDYFDRPDGLARYTRDFNRQIALTRRRKTANCKTVDALAYIPPSLERTLLLHALRRKARAFGHLGITILKDAKVFGAPLGDAGHSHGFIAIGGVTYPTEDGKQVGCIVVKGPDEKIHNYPRLLREALSRPAEESD